MLVRIEIISVSERRNCSLACAYKSVTACDNAVSMHMPCNTKAAMLPYFYLQAVCNKRCRLPPHRLHTLHHKLGGGTRRVQRRTVQQSKLLISPK
jgi:hypothetical protein